MSFRNHVKCGVCLCAIVLQQTEEAGVFFFFVTSRQSFYATTFTAQIGLSVTLSSYPKMKFKLAVGSRFCKGNETTSVHII